MTLDQWIQFAEIAGACLIVIACFMLFGFSIGADVTALQNRHPRDYVIGDLITTGGKTILLNYAARLWKRRQRRKAKRKEP